MCALACFLFEAGIHARQRIKLKLLYAILLIVNSALHGGTNIIAMGAEFPRPHRKFCIVGLYEYTKLSSSVSC